MDCRERVTRAIMFAKPDRLPIMHSALPGAMIRYGGELERLFQRYPSDILRLGYADPAEYGEQTRVESRDAWGALWVRLDDNYKGQVVEHPLADWRDFKTYRFPDPQDREDLNWYREAIQKDRGEHYVVVDAGTLFQRMFYLRGFEALLVDLAVGREEIYALRDGILDYLIRRLDRLIELDIDGFVLRDDWGTQDRLMIHPSLWRTFFKPAYGKIVDLAHSGGAHLFFHSDGYIQEIIPDLLEIGVDVLNPQLSVFDIDELGRELGEKVCIQTDLDRQHILPWGSEEEVEQHVRHILQAFGRFDGGCIGCGQIGPDVPLCNAEAMFRAFEKYGVF